MSAEGRDYGQLLARWAEDRPEIHALILIGSRAPSAAGTLRVPDRHSDWDFHIITSRPERFLDRAWTADLPDTRVIAYSVTRARVGGLPRVTILFADAEADLIILPAGKSRILRSAAALGLYRNVGVIRKALQDLAVVIRPGWRFLKRNPGWESWYARSVVLVPDPRLDNSEIVGLAELFVCHWFWVHRKIGRGELRTAARILERELVETNFRLFHEIKLRRGEMSFPEARRLEQVASAAELAELTIEIRMDTASLRDAADQTAGALRKLVKELVGAAWKWPDVTPPGA